MIIKIIKNEINRNKIVYAPVYLYTCCSNDLYNYVFITLGLRAQSKHCDIMLVEISINLILSVEVTMFQKYLPRNNIKTTNCKP